MICCNILLAFSLHASLSILLAFRRDDSPCLVYLARVIHLVARRDLKLYPFAIYKSLSTGPPVVLGQK